MIFCPLQDTDFAVHLVRITAFDALVQQLQIDGHGVEGIADLMGETAGKLPHIGHVLELGSPHFGPLELEEKTDTDEIGNKQDENQGERDDKSKLLELSPGQLHLARNLTFANADGHDTDLHPDPVERARNLVIMDITDSAAQLHDLHLVGDVSMTSSTTELSRERASANESDSPGVVFW